MWSNDIKINFFFQKINKSPMGWGLCSQTPVWGVSKLHYFTQHASQFRHLHFSAISLSLLPVAKSCFNANTQAMASDLSFYDIFAPQKVPILKIFIVSLHMICGFGPLSNEKFWLRLCFTMSHILCLVKRKHKDIYFYHKHSLYTKKQTANHGEYRYLPQMTSL